MSALQTITNELVDTHFTHTAKLGGKLIPDNSEPVGEVARELWQAVLITDEARIPGGWHQYSRRLRAERLHKALALA